MCVPKPSSNGHSLFGFGLCEHGEDQLLGKKAPSILIETLSCFVCFSLLLFTHVLSSCFFSSVRIYCPHCLLVWNVYECFTHYICTYVCMCVLHCVHVCIHVCLVAWEPEESIISSGSGVKDSWAAMLVLGTLQGPLQSTLHCVAGWKEQEFPKS